MPDLDRLRRSALVCAGACLLGFTLPAAAYEPMPVAVSTQWDGFYIGGQLGGAWSEADWHYDNPNFFNTLGPTLLGRNFSLDASGVIGGAQLGYNYQTGSWVLGIEGSLAAAALDTSRWSPFFPDLDRYSTDIQWLTTITGRLGYAQGRWLAYAKAGWAGAEVGLNLVDVIDLTRATGDQWANGWTVGGGGEYAFGGGFSVAVEYGYVDLDIDHWRVHCRQCGTASFEATPIVDGDIVVQSVTARLNYRFGS